MPLMPDDLFYFFLSRGTSGTCMYSVYFTKYHLRGCHCFCVLPVFPVPFAQDSLARPVEVGAGLRQCKMVETLSCGGTA